LDHCEGILLALERGRPGEKYNIGGGNERTNLEIVRGLCAVLGPCALTSPVVSPTGVVSDFGGQYLHLVVQGAASAPASFDAAPIPPPPQA